MDAAVHVAARGGLCLARTRSLSFNGTNAHPAECIGTASLRPVRSQRPGTVVSARRDATSSEDDSDPLPRPANVVLEKKDYSLRELLIMVDEGDLNLQPQYQRGLVWEKKMASRLVVTALSGRVVPTIYLEETEEGKYMIMDGKQRLTSLLSFISGKKTVGGITWENAPVQLDLNKDECDDSWIGKTFQDLDKDLRQYLRKYSIQCVIVKCHNDRDVVYGIYQDINTGAVGHTEQQNRKAAFPGTYIALLDELVNTPEFLQIQGREAPDSEKAYDGELVLRFFAMLRSAEQFKAPLLRFLNQELKAYQHADEAEITRLREAFKTTVSTVWQILGPQACRLTKAESSPASSSAKAKKTPDLKGGAASLWDATMVAIRKELDRNKYRRKELVDAAGAIKAAYADLCDDKEFRASLANTSKRNVLRRVDMMRSMLERVAPSRRG